MAFVVAAFILKPIIRAIIEKIATAFRSKPMEEVAPAASWIILPVCLTWAARTAPISSEWALPIHHASYTAIVIIVLATIRKLILSSMDWATRNISGLQALSAGFIPLLRNLITLFILMLGAILILKHFGYDVWSLITALGVGSLAVGLAAKDTLSHMISGFILIIDRNLRPGDRISFAGASGTIEEIGLRSTRILTSAGSSWIVPNSELVNTKILNSSLPLPATRVVTVVKVTLETSLDRVREIGQSVLNGIPEVQGRKELEARLQSLAEGNQAIELSFWVPDDSPELQAKALSNFLHSFVQKALREGLSFAGATPAPPAT